MSFQCHYSMLCTGRSAAYQQKKNEKKNEHGNTKHLAHKNERDTQDGTRGAIEGTSTHIQRTTQEVQSTHTADTKETHVMVVLLMMKKKKSNTPRRILPNFFFTLTVQVTYASELSSDPIFRMSYTIDANGKHVSLRVVYANDKMFRIFTYNGSLFGIAVRRFHNHGDLSRLYVVFADRHGGIRCEFTGKNAEPAIIETFTRELADAIIMQFVPLVPVCYVPSHSFGDKKFNDRVDLFREIGGLQPTDTNEAPTPVSYGPGVCVYYDPQTRHVTIMACNLAWSEIEAFFYSGPVSNIRAKLEEDANDNNAISLCLEIDNKHVSFRSHKTNETVAVFTRSLQCLADIALLHAPMGSEFENARARTRREFLGAKFAKNKDKDGVDNDNDNEDGVVIVPVAII